jgi:hypothetical protein
MNTRTLLLASALVVTALTGRARADGEEMHVHNNTGHTVLVFLFQDDKVHTDPSGGVQVAQLADTKSTIAHAPHCKFSVLLIDHKDFWHAEFHDCNSTDVTFTKNTGHGMRP